MARRPCCSKEGLNRGAWTVLEDKLLKSYIMTHGDGNWRSLPKKAGLKRCGKSCRLRWLNYLRPDIKRGNISEDEEELIIRLHNLLGNRWSLIAGRLPGRTDNEIKNYWNTALAKKAKSNNICKSKPESSPETSQQENNISKVIRTKATRCRAKLVFFPSPVLNPVITSSDHNDDDRLSPLPLLVSDFESTLEGHEIFNGVLNDRERDEDHRLGLTLNFDDRDDWVPNSTDLSCLGDGDNDTMDFESLAFLLESDEWPSSALN